MDHQNVARVLGITMDPYRIVYDWVSDKDVIKYISTEEGIDRVVLVCLVIFAIRFVLRSGLKHPSSFRMSLKVLAIYILRTSFVEDSEA